MDFSEGNPPLDPGKVVCGGGGGGSTLNVSSDGDDQRIFRDAKFFILIFFG